MFGLGALVSGVGSVLGAVCSGVASACTAIGGAVISTGRILIDAIKQGLPMAEKICDVALIVGKAIGIFSSESSEHEMYELGMRTEQSIENGVSSERFESTQKYIDHLRQKISLSKENIERLDNLSDVDKIKYASLGAAVTLAAINDEYSIEIPETFWSTSIKTGIEPDQFKPLLDTFESAQLQPDLDGFLKGELPSGLQRQIYDLMDDKLEGVLSEDTMTKILG